EVSGCQQGNDKQDADRGFFVVQPLGEVKYGGEAGRGQGKVPCRSLAAEDVDRKQNESIAYQQDRRAREVNELHGEELTKSLHALGKVWTTHYRIDVEQSAAEGENTNGGDEPGGSGWSGRKPQ